MELIVKLAKLGKALILQHVIEGFLIFDEALPLQILKESDLSIKFY
jgi:hypothetical protein